MASWDKWYSSYCMLLWLEMCALGAARLSRMVWFEISEDFLPFGWSIWRWCWWLKYCPTWEKKYISTSTFPSIIEPSQAAEFFCKGRNSCLGYASCRSCRAVAGRCREFWTLETSIEDTLEELIFCCQSEGEGKNSSQVMGSLFGSGGTVSFDGHIMR